MIKVLNIISDSNIGGGGRTLLNYLRCHDRARFQVSVALPRGSALEGPVRELGVAVRPVDGMADRSAAPGAVAPLRRVIREIQPDLVHTHASVSGRLAARLCGKKVLYTKHCAFPPGALRGSAPGRLMTRLADGCLSDGVIALGPAGRENLMLSGIPDRRIHVMLNGVSPLPFPTREERRAARSRFGFGEDDFVLGILARVEEYKGHDLLLDAAAELLRQGRRVRVLVAGQGGAEPALRLRAAELPEGSVVFAGFIEQVEQALWAMDVQVNASTVSENCSTSLLEGMSIGLPAVASDVGGNPALILDGKNGLLFPRGDSRALVACVSRLMDSPEELSAMRERAKEVFQSNFTGEIFARNLERIYLDVLKGAVYGKRE